MTDTYRTLRAVRSLASSNTMSATSTGRENRPVTICRAAPAATSSGAMLPAALTVAATPTGPSHKSGDRSGCDRIDADSALTEFLRQRLGEVRECGLSCRVVDNERVGQPRVHRAGVDDGTRTGFEHDRQRGPGRADGGHHVQIPGGFPHLVGHGEESRRSRRRDANVVDQYVDAIAGCVD